VLAQHPASGSGVTPGSGMTSRDDDTASAATTAGAAQVSSQMENLKLGAESLTTAPSAAAPEAPPPPAQASTAVETYSGAGVPYAHRFSTVSQGPVGEATLNGVLATDLVCWERFRDVPCACSADGGGGECRLFHGFGSGKAGAYTRPLLSST